MLVAGGAGLRGASVSCQVLPLCPDLHAPARQCSGVNSPRKTILDECQFGGLSRAGAHSDLVSRHLKGAFCKAGPAPGSQGPEDTPVGPQLSEKRICDFRRIPRWKLFPAVLKRPAAPANGLCEPEG